MAKNLCAKKVEPQNAYEVWEAGEFIYYVLRKYQSPDKEAHNPYARWYCMTVSPTCPKGEYGDAYISTVKYGATKLDYNPLTHTDDEITG
jgi:hypothetical protein